MNTKISWFIIGVLFILTVPQTLFLINNKKEMYRMPIFLPASIELEQRLKSERQLVQTPENGSQSRSVGRITVDDLVRGMLSLEQDENLVLSNSQASWICPLLKEMTEKRKRLLELRNMRHHLNEYSMDFGILIAQNLTPKQFAYVVGNRDEALLILQEAPYWEELIKYFENKTIINYTSDVK